jgi:hypothetical protein
MLEYTCANCKQTFQVNQNEDWNTKEMAREFIELYPECKNDPTDIVCDDCFNKFNKWFATLGEKEKQKMRKGFFQ